MANNVAVTAGTGTTMATDDVAGVHYPAVKLVDGTEDTATRIAAGGGVEANALRVTIASDSTGVVSIDDNGGSITVDGSVAITGGSFSLESGADPLTTGNDIDVIEPTITISTTAYTANDVVGGPITITNAMGTLNSGILQSIFVQFKGALTPDLDIYLFNALPTQTTTDNNPFAWSTSDDAKLVWVQHVLTADYITIPGATTRTFAPILPGYPALKSTGVNMYAFIVAVDAFTAASTSDLRVGFGMARD